MADRVIHHHHGTGIASLGGVIACILSYWVNHSIGWAMLHLFCGWFYIIYWIFARGAEVIPNWPF